MQSEEDVLRWLAKEYGLAYTTLDDMEPDRQLLSLFPARILLKEELLPLRRLNGTVEVATSRLFATQGLDALKTLTGLNLKPVLASSEAIQREMKKRLGVGADTIGTLDEDKSFQVVDENAEDTNLDAAAGDEASIIRFVNQVLKDAIELRASDIHLEPFEDEFRIRYRIDGVLQDISVPAQLKRFQPAIVSRVKILSHLNIAEKRLPQDGRIKIRIDEAEVDIRVSIIPMLHGEAVVMRLLRQNATLRGMDELDMDERELDCFRRVLQLPHGIILVTGPTGSGKTSTLYTALNEINDAVRKIITIEDPVEYQLKGVNQIQVSEKAGLTFARGLRSILRHDPDVILIGEIRDQETAQIAVQASLTGHLVFSTLHTNDAPGAVTRLVDMGVEPYLVASSLEAVLAQRLVRVLCPHCKQADNSPTAQALKEQARHSRQNHDLPFRRLPRMPQHRIFRPARDFRMDGQRQRNPAARLEKRLVRPDSRRRAPRRHENAGRRRLAAGAHGHHDGRGSFERDHRQGGGAARRSGRAAGDSRRPPMLDIELNHAHVSIQRIADRWRDRGRPARCRRPARRVAPDGRRSACARSALRNGRRRRNRKTVRPCLPVWKSSEIFLSNFSRSKVSAKALENFTRLLSSLLAAGVPLSRALVILYKEASSPVVSAKWKEIHDLVVDGMSLADAMAKSPDVFPRVYVAMVEAGETGGFLDVVLAQIADFQSREKELRSKVLSAMIYPCILFCLALVVLTVLLVFFIPRFQKVFASVRGTLPLITQIIIGVSHVVRSYGFFVAAGLVGAAFLVRTWFASEKGRRVWERTGAALAAGRPAGRAIRHGPLLPDAGHVARRGRAAGAGLERRAPFHRQPDPRGRRRHNPSSASSKAAGSDKAWRTARICSRFRSGNGFGGGGKRQTRHRTGPHRQRDRGGSGPEPENRGGVRRTADAVFDRRIHRHHFHRHVAAGLLLAGLHQMKSNN